MFSRLIIALILIPFSIGVGSAQSKHHIDLATGQYYSRENGVFELDFIYPNGGAPAFGLADIKPVTSKEVVELLKLNDQQVSELEIIRKKVRSRLKELKARGESTKELEVEYRSKVFDVFDSNQRERWNWLNNRNVFFSAGLIKYLSRKDIQERLKIGPEQLQQIKGARERHASWLRKEINSLYTRSILELTEDASAKTKRRIRDLLNAERWETSGVIGTPSTLNWFCESEKNQIRFEPRLGFVQTTWRMNLNSELVCTLGTSYETGMDNLSRFYFFYYENYANELQAEEITKELEYLSSVTDFYDKFFDRNEKGEVPFITFMEKLFHSTEKLKSDDSFQIYSFQCNVRNIGLINALKKSISFENAAVDPRDIRLIQDKAKGVAESMEKTSQRVLSTFIRNELTELSVNQRTLLHSSLIPKKSELTSMVPLELVYFGIVIGDADRSSYRRSRNRISGNGLPDFDLLGGNETTRFLDSREPRFRVKN